MENILTYTTQDVIFFFFGALKKYYHRKKFQPTNKNKTKEHN